MLIKQVMALSVFPPTSRRERKEKDRREGNSKGEGDKGRRRLDRVGFMMKKGEKHKRGESGGKNNNDIRLTWDNRKMHKSIEEWCLRQRQAQKSWDAPKHLHPKEIAKDRNGIRKQSSKVATRQDKIVGTQNGKQKDQEKYSETTIREKNGQVTEGLLPSPWYNRLQLKYLMTLQSFVGQIEKTREKITKESKFSDLNSSAPLVSRREEMKA